MSRRRVVLGVCTIGTLLLAGCNGFRAASANFEDDAPVQATVTAVRLESGSGSVKVRTGGTPGIHRKVYYVKDKPGASTHFEGDTLVLEDCRQNGCSIDYDVVLPAGAKIMGEVGSGDITVLGMAEVGVRTGSGDVVVRDVTGPVTVRTGSGDADLSGLGQSAVVEASSGDVKLTNIKGDATVLSRSGNVIGNDLGGKTAVESSSGDVTLMMSAITTVKATASSGNIQIHVPRGENYHVATHTSSGDENINITSDPSAKSQLTLDASSGDISVDYR
jgi:hypothetical protein